jgi:hypothetical protein
MGSPSEGDRLGQGQDGQSRGLSASAKAGCIGKELRRTLGQPDTGIRDDQADSGKTTAIGSQSYGR